MTDFLWGFSAGVAFALFLVAIAVSVLAGTRDDG